MESSKGAHWATRFVIFKPVLNEKIIFSVGKMRYRFLSRYVDIFSVWNSSNKVQHSKQEVEANEPVMFFNIYENKENLAFLVTLLARKKDGPSTAVFLEDENTQQLASTELTTSDWIGNFGMNKKCYSNSYSKNNKIPHTYC